MIGRMKLEMKNLSYLWWIVLASLVAPSFVSRLNNDPNKKAVATINGNVLDVARFKRQYMMMQSERQMFNQRYGLNLDLNVDPSMVVDRTASAMLIDDVASAQNFVVDPAVLSAMIRKSLSALFGAHKDGFNLALYNHYIRQAGMTVKEFEGEQEATVRGSFVEDALRSAVYAPLWEKHAAHKKEKKSFAMLRFSKDAYFKHAKAEANITDKEIEAYFESHKAHYRLPDIKRASYVVVDAHSYAKQVSMTDEQIEKFYNRRKDTQYKEKDHYRMRRLLIAVPQGSSDVDVASFKVKADEFLARIMANKDEFAEIAKSVSDDAKTAKKGGMTEEFTLGTFSPELEEALCDLSNNGDVTPLVRTQEGFECAQLVSKKMGAYKSLESVRKEIISAFTARATAELLRADIESMMKEARDGDLDLATFAKSRHAKVEESGDLEAASAQDEGIKGEIAKKIFGTYSEKPQSRGSFALGDKNVVFVVTASELDRYPVLETIKTKIVNDMIQKTSNEKLNNDVRLAQKAFFDEKKTLFEIEPLVALASFDKTSTLKKTDTIKGAEKDHSITQAFFKLEDSSMLSRVACQNGDIILATLLASEAHDEDDSKDHSSGEQNIQMAEENLVSGFIASLKRNARIEISDDQVSSAS